MNEEVSATATASYGRVYTVTAKNTGMIDFICIISYACFRCKLFGSSFTHGRNSRPCIYGRSTSGTTRPYDADVEQGVYSRINRTYLWCLVILHDATQRTLSGAKGAVQHVHVDLAHLILHLKTATNLKSSSLCHTR